MLAAKISRSLKQSVCGPGHRLDRERQTAPEYASSDLALSKGIAVAQVPGQDDFAPATVARQVGIPSQQSVLARSRQRFSHASSGVAKPGGKLASLLKYFGCTVAGRVLNGAARFIKVVVGKRLCHWVHTAVAADAVVQEHAAVAARGYGRRPDECGQARSSVFCTCSMSWHKWFSIVKRNMARLVPAIKNASAAARVVMTPAVAAGGRLVMRGLRRTQSRPAPHIHTLQLPSERSGCCWPSSTPASPRLLALPTYKNVV